MKFFLLILSMVTFAGAAGRPPYKAEVRYEFSPSTQALLRDNGCILRDGRIEWTATYVSLPGRRPKAGRWVDSGLMFSTMDRKSRESGFWGSPIPRRRTTNSSGRIVYSVLVSDALSAADRNLSRRKAKEQAYRNIRLVGDRFLIQGLSEDTIAESTRYSPSKANGSFGLAGKICS